MDTNACSEVATLIGPCMQALNVVSLDPVKSLMQHARTPAVLTRTRPSLAACSCCLLLWPACCTSTLAKLASSGSVSEPLHTAGRGWRG